MSDARIYDLGYRHYDGTRLPPRSATLALARHSFAALLGLRRSIWAKLINVVIGGIAYLPAIVFVGLVVFLPRQITDAVVPQTSQYLGFVTAAVFMFLAIGVPVAICPDRRHGTLALYLASPLDRDTYLVAKAAAVVAFLMIVTVGPPLVFVVGLILLGFGPDGVVGVLLEIGRVIASGMLMSAVFAMVGLAIASLTDRRGAAAGFIVLFLLASQALVRGLAINGLGLSQAFVAPRPARGHARGRGAGLRHGRHRDAGCGDVARVRRGRGLARRRRRLRAVALPPAPGDAMTAPPPPPPVLAFDVVSKRFGDVVALTDVSFSIGPGMTALLGPNGAGKSTLLRLLCGLTAPSAGRVRVLGQDPRADVDVLRRIGLVPQQEAVFEHLAAHAFVAAAAALHGLDDPDAAATGALTTVDLDPTEHRPVKTYSKGMRQRVKLAQALVHDPPILLLDEPLEGLDPRQRATTIGLFRRLADEGRTVVVSSHVLAEVERFGSRIVLLAGGRVAAAGDFHEIRDLMDDRPRRIRVRADRPRVLATALLAGGMADGVHLDGEGVVVDTADAAGFRRLLATTARDHDVVLREVVALDEDLESVFRYLTTTDGTARPAERERRP